MNRLTMRYRTAWMALVVAWPRSSKMRAAIVSMLRSRRRT